MSGMERHFRGLQSFSNVATRSKRGKTMGKPALYLICLGLLATATQAQPVIEFYFSLMSDESIDPYGPLPPEYVNGENLAWIGDEAYLWCRTPYDPASDWVGIALYFTGDVTGGSMRSKATTTPSVLRWETGSDFDPAPDESINLLNVTNQGIGTGEADDAMIWEDDMSHLHYCLGSVYWG